MSDVPPPPQSSGDAGGCARILVQSLPVPSCADSSAVYAASDFPDTALFDETVDYPAVSVPSRQTASFKKKLKDVMVQGSRNVYPDPGDSARRILVLNVGVTETDLGLNDDDNEDAAAVQWVNSFPVTRHYADLSADEVLRMLLPASIREVPSSFELVGHLAHVNLRDDCLPYRYWIGRVLLDKNAAVKTVVNKVGTIDDRSVFRTFDQEVLAGCAEEPDWSVTTVHEHGCSFQLDYRHVYWNSRLSGEHQRLVQLIQQEARTEKSRPVLVADLMAGVGPFAVPLTSAAVIGSGKRRQRSSAPPSSSSSNNIIVHANDLNPVSYQYLKVNAAKNKCVNLHCSNSDARAFLKDLQTQVAAIDHVIMNLPATAPEFLDAFRGWTLETLPRVHVHCFAPKLQMMMGNNATATDGGGSDAPNHHQSSVIDRCAAALGCPIANADIHIVRDVSPGKNMVCVSFRLPAAAKALQLVPPPSAIGIVKPSDKRPKEAADKGDTEASTEPKRAKRVE